MEAPFAVHMTMNITSTSDRLEDWGKVVETVRELGLGNYSITTGIKREPQYTLVSVPKGGTYISTGEGEVALKVRAITRDENGRINSKRGIVIHTEHVYDVPAILVNVYKEWDGFGELQYFIQCDPINPAIDLPFKKGDPSSLWITL